MRNKRKPLIILLICCLGMILLSVKVALNATGVPGSLADDTESIRVPDGNGKPVLLDGLFSPGEWEDAEKIDVHPNVNLYLKKYGGHIFVGIKITPYKTSVVDMFISPDGKNIYHLHASAQISERLVSENSGPWDNPSFIWGYSIDWYANEIRWDNGKMQELMKKGKSQNDAQEMSYFKYDGFEFQIKQSKFPSDHWFFRIEVPMAPDFDKPVIFPSDTVLNSTKGWIRLEIGDYGNKRKAVEKDAEMREISKAIDSCIGWFKTKNFELLFNTIADDPNYISIHPSNRVVRGIEQFKKNAEIYKDPGFQYVRHELKDLTINLSKSGDVAWFYCILDDINTWKGQPANWENARWTGVLEKREGGWGIVQQHFSFAAD